MREDNADEDAGGGASEDVTCGGAAEGGEEGGESEEREVDSEAHAENDGFAPKLSPDAPESDTYDLLDLFL